MSKHERSQQAVDAARTLAKYRAMKHRPAIVKRLMVRLEANIKRQADTLLLQMGD